ncbi:hypothetical protein KL86DES1_21132 [uncultured Desulfovibrio sp.]|uniref:Uncharacterized protein n=1 Tax=uncultured Desulfovibrio sp. TaxID=167968 RepID=A0A212L6N5_9BACT|nr:hypothetical protein KL86DES1_21132 [uncultured Desulfovibrio sp.]
MLTWKLMLVPFGSFRKTYRH